MGITYPIWDGHLRHAASGQREPCGIPDWVHGKVVQVVRTCHLQTKLLATEVHCGVSVLNQASTARALHGICTQRNSDNDALHVDHPHMNQRTTKVVVAILRQEAKVLGL